MIYITEQNLRDLYGKQAFESFTLVEGERLTPGARQFLADRQISIVDPADVKPSKTATIRIDGTENTALMRRRPLSPRKQHPVPRGVRRHCPHRIPISAMRNSKAVFVRSRRCI